MPVAAAGQADVGAADPHPAVLLRGGDQRGQKLTVGILDGGALGERAPRLGDPARERVANLLQLTEPEHPRRPGCLDPMRDEDPAKTLGDERAELALQLADLPTQLGAGAVLSGGRPALLANQPSAFGSPLGEKRQPVRLPLKQIRHDQILSRLEGRGGNP